MRLGTSNKAAGKARAAAVALLVPFLITAGCDDPRFVASDVAPAADPLAQITGVNIPDPNGTYFAEVYANGTGCPQGTWNTRIAPDGQVFTTTFSAYVADVRPGTTIMAKDCIISIKFHSPVGRSFSVQRFSYAGFALLNEGVIGTQSADYWFQGRPVAKPDSNRKELVGPWDDDYVFTDEIKLDDRVWSPCGVERDLNINTRITLQNSVNRSGYMNLSSIDGSTGKLEVAIESRRCSIGAPDEPPTKPDTKPDAGSTKPPDQQPPTQVGPVQPTNVRLSPSSVRRDQPFTVSWSPGNASSSTAYVVEVHEHYDFGYALVWRSPETSASSLRYSGPALPKVGAYHVVVVAREGNRMVSSDRALLTVTQSATNPPPVDDKPDPGTDPTPPPVVNPSSRLPSWARPLVGRYAMRTDAYAVASSGTVLSGVQLALADFVETSEGGLELRVQPCSLTTKLSNVTHTLRNPESFPVQRRKVVLEPGERWSTDGAPFAVGFLRDGAPQCSGRRPGDYVTKSPEQAWNRSATCRCGAPGEVPRLDDCRVIDPDRDGKPGLAYDWSGPTSVDGKVSHAVGVKRGRYVGGRVSGSGAHNAQYVNDEVGYELLCENGQCDNSMASLRPCTPDYNAAQFAPAPSLTCADLRARQGTLFQQPTAPRSCTRGEMTNAP